MKNLNSIAIIIKEQNMNSEEIFYQLQYYNDRLTEQLNGTAEVKLTRSQLGNLYTKVNNLYIKYQKSLYKEDNSVINTVLFELVLLLIECIIFIVLYHS